MQENKPEYYDPIYKKMLSFFYQQFYSPLLIAIDKPNIKLNAAMTYLIAAINSGKIQYKDGIFTGQFNIKTSRELSSFAEYDRRSQSWKGRPGPDVLSAAVFAESKRKNLVSQLQQALDIAEDNINQNISDLSLGDALPMWIMQDDIKKDLYKVGIMPEITEGDENKFKSNYTENQQLNIKNWVPDQIERLRNMVQEYQTTGTDESLQFLIQQEYNVSANKAHFLARQETGLFFSKLSMDRASSTGVRRYKWSTSHDERVRLDHKLLDKQIIDFNNPPIVDRKTGRRAHAGEDFGCRCQKIWMLD